MKRRISAVEAFSSIFVILTRGLLSPLFFSLCFAFFLIFCRPFIHPNESQAVL